MPSPTPDSAFVRLGGEPALRAIIADFVARVFSDVMIGFFFRDVDRRRIETFEYQLAAEFLGAGVAYHGRPLREAHARHRIMGGQFARRTQLLRETLADHGVPPDIATQWLQHTEDLRPLVTGQPDGTCDSTS